MKSRLLVTSGVVLSLVLAYGAVSWYTGRQAQIEIEQAVVQANQQLSAAWPAGQERPTVQVQDYRRGWFSSAIEYAFTFKDDAGQDQVLRLHDDLEHGPFPWRAVSAGEFSPMLAYSQIRLLPSEVLQAWFDSQQGGSPLQVDTRVSFGGVAQSLWRFHPAKLVQDGEQIDFSGGQIEIEFDRQLRTSVARGTFDSLVWADTANGERGELKAMTFEGRSALSGEENMQIHNLVRIGRIAVSQDQEPALALADMQVRLDSSRTGGLLDSVLAYEFGSIRVGDADLGQAQAVARIEHIDVDAFKALMGAWEQLNPEGIDEESLSSEEQDLLKVKIQALLASSPSAAIDPLKWKNPQGESKALLAIHFMPVPADAEPDEALGVLLERSLRQIQIGLSVSKPMLVQVFEQMNGGEDADRMRALASMLFDHYTASMQRAGLIEVEDGVASLNVSYEGGEVTLGSAKMSVAAFMALIQGVMGGG